LRPTCAGWPQTANVLSQKFAEQERRESHPYFVGNSRQVSRLAAVSFAFGADYDTFVAKAAAIPFGDATTND
jgi:hypothetical protein